MTKTIAALAVVAFALVGCSTGASDEQVEHNSLPTSAEHFIEYRPGGSKFIGPVEASVPAPTVTETASESMTDLLLPPTDAVVTEVPKGSLGVFTEDYAPQSALDTLLDVYLPEENK